MSTQAAARSWSQTLGAGRDWRRRVLFHHAPLAIASAVGLVLFMNLSSFNANAYGVADLFSGRFPKEFDDSAGAAQHTGPPTGTTDHGGGQPPPQQGADHENIIGGGPTGATEEGSGRASGRDLLGLNVRQFTFATGYVATVLLALTLLIGPANLLLRRRRPISNYLARDVGTWAAVFSVIHVFYGVEVHSSITDPLPMFLRDGSPLTISFGLANWAGLAATVIVVGLLAISSDIALRKLKARTWKNIQRLNYALFALVIAHAYFYGALVRLESPFTLLLGLSVAAVFVGQAVGIWLWRRRYARTGGTLAQQPG